MLLEVVKCFLCACAANDAGRKATCSPPASAGARGEVVSICIYKLTWGRRRLH